MSDNVDILLSSHDYDILVRITKPGQSVSDVLEAIIAHKIIQHLYERRQNYIG